MNFVGVAKFAFDASTDVNSKGFIQLVKAASPTVFLRANLILGHISIPINFKFHV
jgi:hypothetical protein